MKTLINIWYFYVVVLFVKKPKEKLLWSVKDFNKCKLWAKTQRDPAFPNRSLWDRCYSIRYDSTETLHNINQFI